VTRNTTIVLSSPSTSTSQPDPTTPPTPNDSGWLGRKLPLPHNREGVRTWPHAKGLFPLLTGTGFIPRLAAASFGSCCKLAVGVDSTDWSVKLSDLFNGKKGSGLMTDWEDMGLRLPLTRPRLNNAGRLFVSENVESGAKSVQWVLRIRR
jgi:hypothetical protein